MSSIPRRKLRRISAPDQSVWNIKTIAALAVILSFVALLLFGITRLKQSRVESLPKEFEGRIVDKWAGYSESEQGSSPYYRVVIEVEGQNRYTVPVNQDIYQRAQVGMHLKRSEKGLEVIRAPSS
ncbi:MAG TPA: hypothetical protein VLA93_22840 [Pyrinomonadaceae bacterium]|nr:hypothetical protein [Pyrinomonadaceae bacterium]